MSSDPAQRERPRRGVMFVISSPSGAGKTTLCRRLISEVPGVELSVSATTRSPRPGESDAVDYHFRSVEQFERMIDEDDFLEWAKVFKNFYGTPRSEVEARLVAGTGGALDAGLGAVGRRAGNHPGPAGAADGDELLPVRVGVGASLGTTRAGCSQTGIGLERIAGGIASAAGTV